MLTALQSIHKCIQRDVPRDPGNRILRLWQDICRTLYLKGTVLARILAEVPSGTPLDLVAELPRAFKEVAQVRTRISRAQKDLDTERRLAKLPRRKILNQIFDRKQSKLYLLVQTESSPQRPSPAAIYQHYTDVYRSRITDEVNEQFRTPDIMGQGVRIWTPPAEIKYNRRNLLIGGDRIRPPLRLPGDQVNKGTLAPLLWMGGATPRTALKPTLRELEADIQASEAQALQEDVRRLIKAREDQEAPALRAYLTRFRQRAGIFQIETKTRKLDCEFKVSTPNLNSLPPQQTSYPSSSSTSKFMRLTYFSSTYPASEPSSSTKDNALPSTAPQITRRRVEHRKS
eukprot:g59626.t1